ncbi:MAG: hypothetical protein WEB85_15230 [Dongiaceae bacterium]
MDTEEEGMQTPMDIRLGRRGAPAGVNRRQALARLGLGASIVYAAPLLLSLGEARASGASGGGGGGGEGGGGGSSDGGDGDGAGSGAESSSPSAPSAPSGAAADGTAAGTTGTAPEGGVIGDPTADPTIVTDLGTTLP